MDDKSKYYLDIFGAVLSIREVEGDNFLISIPIPNPQFEFLRYKKYPYSFPCMPLLMKKYGDINKAVSVLYKERINPYLKDSILNYDVS